jgi:hypothetical protein
MSDDENYIRFTAALPGIATAINIDGMGDGARIKLDVPRTDIEAVLKLQMLAGEIFEVIIIPLDRKMIKKPIKTVQFLKDKKNEQSQTDSIETSGRQSRQKADKQKRTKAK